jgi:hypothetical protein
MRSKDQILPDNLYDVKLKKRKLYSWMDSNGDIISNKYGDGHYQTASIILKTKYNIPDSKMIFDYEIFEYLFDRQWLRIKCIGYDIFCNNNKIKYNSKQLEELKNLCIENNMKRVIFDNDKCDYKILWTSEDKL